MTCGSTNGTSGGGNHTQRSQPNSYDKWRFSIIGGFIVLLIFNSYTFKLTNDIFGSILNKRNCPTFLGYILHTIVYILLVRLSMGP
jgi:hypothetical protein